MSPPSLSHREAFVQNALVGTRFAKASWISETGSTNTDLLLRAQAGEGEQVLITDLQTAGKGRRGRAWEAPAGSGVLMSVLIRDVALRDGFWAVGAVALAASKAIDELTISPCTVKWPNDVLLGPAGSERKVAGVLSQVADDAVIVGIGINANWPSDVPAVMAERGTSVNRHTAAMGDVDRAALAVATLTRATGYLEGDAEALRQAWKSQCSTIGQRVRLEMHDHSIVGVAVDINADGSLQIQNESGISSHHVGDVVHLRPTS